MENYYEILEIDIFSDISQIEKSYKQKAKIYHPDLQSGDEIRFKKILEAYEVLRDSKKRLEYDLKLQEEVGKKLYFSQSLQILTNLIERNEYEFRWIDYINVLNSFISRQLQELQQEIEEIKLKLSNTELISKRFTIKVENPNIEEASFRSSLNSRLEDRLNRRKKQLNFKLSLLAYIKENIVDSFIYRVDSK